ncbi:MAG: hypothetical protein Q9165_005932 [Trypethelium subeluteriae]
MADTVYTLNTGAQIPALGLGTWQSDPGQVKAAVSHAIQKGYRHIDCAYVYENEDEVGQGIKEGLEKSGIKREDLFDSSIDLMLTGVLPKGNNEKFPKLPDGSRDLDESWSHLQTWRELEKLPATGKVRAIGVSNYSVKYLEQLLSIASITPAANQIENHPYLPQQEIVDFCKSKGILVEAYSPLGSTGSPLFQEQGVQEVAEKHKVTAGAVLLSYHSIASSSPCHRPCMWLMDFAVARGLVVLAKSVTPSRIEDNRNVIKLDAADVAALDKISKSKGITRYVYPAFGVSIPSFL